MGLALTARCVVLLALLLWQGCRLPVPGVAPIVLTTDEVTLAWDPPRFVLPGLLGIASYQVFFRVHGTLPWQKIADVPAASGTRCTVSHAQVGDGSFDFAVKAVDALGEASSSHSSMDVDASPVGGWYVIWVTGK